MKMKEIWEVISRNWGMKVISIVLATLIWFTIINVDDPVKTMTFRDIPVTVVNEHKLMEADRIWEIVDGDKIDVTVQGKRSIIENLSVDDFTATADFSSMSEIDTVPIKVGVKGYTSDDLKFIYGYNEVMKLSLEECKSKELRVKVATIGEAKNGFYVGDATSSPNMITISGSETQISKIKEVVVVVDVDQASENIEMKAVPIVYDYEGNVVSESRLTFSKSEVNVTVPILTTKTLNIKVSVVGKPLEGYEITNVSFQPGSIVVAGTNDEISELPLTLNVECDVTDAYETQEYNFNLADCISSELTSVKIAGEDQMLAVTITIVPYDKKDVTMSTAAFEIENLASNRKARIVTDKITVTVHGNSAFLHSLEAGSITAKIDLSGYSTVGQYEVPVEFVTPYGTYIYENKKVTVEIAK